nr:hypothetical protein [Tanacetum cinerariifolium]
MDLESAQNNDVADLFLLKQGDYEMWKLRIEQYFQAQDYALWDVIDNDNSLKPVPRTTANADGTSTSTIPGPVTTEEKARKKNDVKTRSIDATVYAFLANQPNGSQLVHEYLEQIHGDDLEEMDLKWQLTLLSMRARRYFQRTGKKITINGSDTASYDKTKVECLNCHKMGHFVRKCKSPRNQESRPRNQDSSRKTVNVENTSSKAMVAIDGAGFDWSYMADDEVPTNMVLMAFSYLEVQNNKTCSNTCLKSFKTLKTQYENLRIEFNKFEFDHATYKRGLASIEEQLVFYKKNEIVFCDQISVLKRDASFRDSKITALNLQIEKLKKDKESNQIKIDNFENASKSLYKLIGSKITDNNRTGLGFISYNAVAPPPTGLFAPPTIDLSNSGLEEFQHPEFKGYGPKDSKSVCVDTSNDIKKAHNALIIKDWVSDSDEDEYEEMVLKYENVQHKPKNLNNNVKENSVNTAKGNQVTSAVGNQGINAVKSLACWGALQDTLKDQGYFDSGCSRHMTGSISYLTDFKEHDGGYVAFGGGAKGSKITRKGTIRTGKLDFEDVYFVKELQFNLFSVSQMCDKKNSVLFTDTTYFVLSFNFKLADESQVLLKVSRKNNMYSFDMKNIVPQKDLTRLLAKATNDESILWHMRLDHINFKNINKLVKDNFVRGLPLKRFKNDQTFVACLKGKQHKVSFKFTWVFFSATKDETSRILKSFITKIENLVEKKVKIIRCDNGIEFKNRVMNEFCKEKGIKREYSVARTPQQNRVTKRCRVTILNTLDQLGKFDGKSNEGIFVSYSTISKAFRVYNIRTRKVEENLHITFLENKPMIAVPTGTNSNDFVGKGASFDTALDGHNKDKHGPSQATESDNQERPNAESSTKTVNNVGLVNTATPTYADYLNDPLMPDLEDAGIFDDAYDDRDEDAKVDYNNLETVISVSPIPSTIIYKDHPKEHIIGEAIRLFLAYASFMVFIVYQMDVKNAFLYGTIEKEVYVSQPSGFVDPEFLNIVYKVEKALYGLHQAPKAWYETLFTYLLDNGFRRGTIDKTLFIKKIKDDILLVQVYVDDINFGYTKRSLSTQFEQLMHKRFQMSSMRELTFFLGLQSTSTPMETHKPLSKDAAGTNVDVYLYSDYAGSSLDRKSTTGGCQFLGSRIISWQCKKQTIVANSTTEAEYIAASNCYGQVLWLQNQLLDYGYNFMQTKIHVDNGSAICVVKNPVSKTKHIEIRHHFIRYSYKKSFWLQALVCLILRAWIKERLDKKELAIPGQTTTRKELSNLLMAGSLPKTTLPTQLIKTFNDDVRLQALIDGNKVVNSEASIRHDLKLNDAEGTSCLPNAVIFEELARMGAKTTSWNEFNSTMESAIICLANNQKFNFSKYILDNLKKNLEAGVPFYMFPRVFDLENAVIVMKSSHKAKIAELESRVEKLEDENKSLTKEHKSFNSKIESPAFKETVMDKEKSSKQGRKITDIDVNAEVNLENVYNLDLASEKTVLSMQDVTDADGKEVAKEIVEVITTAKIIVDEVSTDGGELNAANEEPVKDKGKSKLVQEPEVLKSRKAQIVIDEEVTRRIKAEWNADMKDNIDWNEVVEHVQSRQFDAKDQTAKKQKGDELEKENAEKQKLEEQQEVKELKRNLKIVPDDEDDVFVNVSPLSSKPSTIVDYKIYKEGKREHFQIIRANEDNVWKLQKGPKGLARMYPLTNYTLQQMFNKVRLQVDYEVEMAYDLLRLVRKQLKEGYVP